MPTKTKPVRFYRSNLETIVWNPDTNSPLADFTKGHFTTEDLATIKRLRKLGYPEIPLDAEYPPDIMVKKPPLLPDDFSVPIIRGTNEVAGDQRTEKFRESITEEQSKQKVTKLKVKSIPESEKEALPKRKKRKRSAAK